MSLLKKIAVWFSFSGMLVLSITGARAGMVGTSEVLMQVERSQIIGMLEQEDVQKQLVELGVHPASSLSRVNQLSDQELAQLSERINELPVGAGISTVDLLLIIIIILLIA